jgi:3-methyladenine DNA glycosylase AlkD
MSKFQRYIINEISSELPKLADKKVAFGAAAYMKGIAPFLGVSAPIRRKLFKEIFKEAPTPTSDELGKTARALWRLDEREYQYAAIDMIAYFIATADRSFLKDHVEFLLSHKSWWDTVDSLGSAAISPLTVKYPSVTLMRAWSNSPNMWINRAAIQHQRGRKTETDIALLFEILNAHSHQNEFFIAKAIGWALRDLSRIDNRAVQQFLASHPHLNNVAVREAKKLGF